MEPVLQTERLNFRFITQADESFFVELSQSAQVMRYISGLPRTKEEAQSDFEKRLRLQDGEHGLFLAECREDGKPVGFFVVRPFEDMCGETETGYRLAEAAWGKGYATEGALAMLDYIFNKLHRPFAIAVTEPGNVASQQVLKKAGFAHLKNILHKNADLQYFRIEAFDFYQQQAALFLKSGTGK